MRKRLTKKILILIPFFAAVFAPLTLAMYVGTHTIVRDVDCAKCHGDIVSEQEESSKSVHRQMPCTNCHGYEGSEEFHRYKLPVTFGALSAACGQSRCHEDEYEDWLEGGHATTAECWMCHTEYTG